jgi:hypothetical protein
LSTILELILLPHQALCYATLTIKTRTCLRVAFTKHEFSVGRHTFCVGHDFGRTTKIEALQILSSDTKFVFRVNAFKICLHEQCFSVSDATAASKDRNNPIFCTVSDAAVASDTEKHCSCKQTFVLS